MIEIRDGKMVEKHGMRKWGARLGIDTGGTFTDVVLITDDANVAVRKVDNASEHYEENMLRGVLALLNSTGTAPNRVEQIAHCTTVLGNAVMQRKGPKTALVTTEGFLDVLELRRQRYPKLYEVFWEKPEPLVPRCLRREAHERISAEGDVVTPLDLDQVRGVLRRLVDEDEVASVAVCFINSFANPEHEQAVASLAREDFPSLSLSVSNELSQEWGEYERTSTTVTDAFVKPILREYLGSLRAKLSGAGIDARLDVMQSSGGVMSAENAVNRPVFCLESGPAAGVMATCALGKHLGIRDAVTLEMGGTTAKATLIEGGVAHRVNEYEIGTPIAIGGRSLAGGGYPLRIPAVDTAEVGAGGGSIAYVDRGGSLRVGPEGAGAVPGPVCYGRGGSRVTVTDANVVLGYLEEGHPLGGEIQVNKKQAEVALEKQVAIPLKLSLHEAADAVRTVANATQARAIRAISVERGRDVRKFALFAFGGGGPGHAADVASLLGVRTVIIPPVPGLFSALGLLWAPPEYHFSRTARIALDESCAAVRLPTLFDALECDAAKSLQISEPGRGSLQFKRYADLHYSGQFHELTIAFASSVKKGEAVRRLRSDFEREHKKSFGYSAPDEAVEVRNVRVIAIPRTLRWRQSAGPRRLEQLVGDLYAPSSALGARRVYFGRECGELDAKVVSRGDLTSTRMAGPLIIPEYDTTIVVPPDYSARLAESGCVVLER